MNTLSNEAILKRLRKEYFQCTKCKETYHKSGIVLRTLKKALCSNCYYDAKRKEKK